MGKQHSTQAGTDSNRVKFLLVGKHFVGKTNLLNKYQYGEFTEEYKQSVGCTLSTFPLLFEGCECRLMVLDSLSDSDFSLDCRLKSIANADIVGLVFDLNDFSSWQDVPLKLQKLQENHYKNAALLLIGAKNDLECQVSTQDVQEFLETQKQLRIEYIETSAKTGLNIEQVFLRALALGVPQRLLKWSRVQAVLFAAKFAFAEEDVTAVSWMNLCEALPNMLNRRQKVRDSLVAKLESDLLRQLIEYL